MVYIAVLVKYFDSYNIISLVSVAFSFCIFSTYWNIMHNKFSNNFVSSLIFLKKI